jgi:hypothetical protein
MITKRTKIMLLVLVAVAVGAYAYLYWWSQTPDHGFLDTVPVVRDASDSAAGTVIQPRTPLPTVPAEGEPAAGDETLPPSMTFRSYEDTTEGFSFSYPETWSVSATDQAERTDVCLMDASGTGGCAVTVSFEEESVNMSEETALEALQVAMREGNPRSSSITIGGLEEGTQLRASGSEGPTRGAVFSHEGTVFWISAGAGNEAVYDKLVSTFLFQSE